MHRVVLYVNPVSQTHNGETLYGRLYSGKNEAEILTIARAEYVSLTFQEQLETVREQWEGEQGEEFRSKEGWTLTYNDDGTVSCWRFDETKYTYDLGFSPIPDEFVQLCHHFAQQVALISGWVPLKMADCNDEDYIVNGAFYDMVVNANDIQWTDADEQEVDDLPF